MRRVGWIVSIGALAVLGIACSTFAQGKKGTQTAPAGKAAAAATAAIEARSGSTVSGTAEFMMHDGKMMITVSVKGAPAGQHAVHIHEKGDCSAPDASSAGGHFNPGGHQHGAPDAAEHHAGDLGNITIGADGTGSLMIHSSDLSLSGTNSVVGHAIIVHEKTDDFVTQPTGNAGGRIGCGVIK
jgi:Cu-Zn family superoxide dismutase